MINVAIDAARSDKGSDPEPIIKEGKTHLAAILQVGR